MDKKFEQKKNAQRLHDNLEELYLRISSALTNIRILSDYCKAYSYQEGVYYFTPFTQVLEKSIEEIAMDMHALVGNKEQSDTKTFSSINFCHFANIIFDEDD